MAKVEKPTSIVREEVISALTNTINSSGLPAFVIAPILQDLLQQTQIIMRQQYENDLAYYKQATEETSDDE